MSSGSDIRDNIQARCRHASRLPDYRTPFGARPTESNVDLFFDAPESASNVTLCYTYGLYKFSYHEEPMHRLASSNRYHVELRLPHESSILFYWFRFNDNGSTLFYGAGWDTRDGEGCIYDCPPRVGADEDKYPYAFQITVYNKDFRTPDCMKGSMIYQIFPDRFARDRNFSFTRMTSASPRTERIYHEDWGEDVDIYGKPETGYLACDFYGGSLKGMMTDGQVRRQLAEDLGVRRE